MGSTLTEISNFLEEEELNYHYNEEEDVIITGFSTKNYVDGDGDKHLGMVIKLEDNGEFLKIFTPSCYSVPNETNRAALMQTLLMVSWRTRMIQFEYDDSAGEIRAIIEFPLEDAILTHKQFMRAVQGLVQIVDRYHPVMHKALTEGVIAFEGSKDPLEELQDAFGQFEKLLESLGIDVDEIRAEIEGGALTETDADDGNDGDDDDEFV